MKLKIILLSGGSGKRLWPLSNDSRSKQFLKVLMNEQGELESMVQRVWRQLGQAGLQQSVIIATSKAQSEMLINQLESGIQLIIEPERRDTFPAIALATSYLYSKVGTNEDETIVVLPVDVYAELGYFDTLRKMNQILQQTKADLVLMGVNPVFGSEKYGYIVPKKGQENHEYLVVDYFKEKPTAEEADRLIREGALWNCGVFAFRMKFLMDIIRSRGLPIDYTELYQSYSMLPKISFDYEVVEKASNIIVTPYSGIWKDLGTWNTLTEEMSLQIVGKGLISEESINTHIVNELDIPVAVLGLSDTIVATSPDGILVSSKDASPRLKDLISFDQRPMYEERRWGWYKVLDYTKYEHGEEVLTKKVHLRQGCNLSYHAHFFRNEIWTILHGQGEVIIEGKHRFVQQNDIVTLPAGMKHAIKANSELEFIEVQKGKELSDLDIQRYCIDWEDIVLALSK
jgi:mannose-1-phosphate guanylyltransferase